MYYLEYTLAYQTNILFLVILNPYMEYAFQDHEQALKKLFDTKSGREKLNAKEVNNRLLNLLVD